MAYIAGAPVPRKEDPKTVCLQVLIYLFWTWDFDTRKGGVTVSDVAQAKLPEEEGDT